MRRKMIVFMAWVQIVFAVALMAAAPWWLATVPEPERKWFFAAAYLIFGAAFLVDAVRDLAKECGGAREQEDDAETYFSAPDGQEVFCDVEMVRAAEGDDHWYICFPDGLRLIVEEGRYIGWYLPEGAQREVMGRG